MEKKTKGAREQEEKKREMEIDLILREMTKTQRESALRQVKSGESLKEHIEERQSEVKVIGVKKLSKEIGVLKRLDKMKECFRKYPHLNPRR
jgi:hypothetical protein